MEAAAVAGVTGDRNQAKITIVGVPDKPGVAARIFGTVAEAHINVDMIIQNISQAAMTDLSFTVPRADLKKAVPIIQAVANDIEAKSVSVTEAIAKVSLIGVGMRSHSGVAAKMFEVLAREGINILMISTSEIKISCVIDEKYLELAMRSLHSAFGLDQA
jgi:aspartate kinase